jgi:hypothetical protein
VIFIWPSMTASASAQSVVPDDSTIHGRVLAVDSAGVPLDVVRVILRTPASVDTALVDETGYFAVHRRLPTAGGELLVDDTARVAPRFHPVIVHLTPEDAWREVRIALLPTRWTIASGRFAGRTVNIDPERAVGDSERGGRFWRLSRGTEDVGVMPIGWPVSNVPIPLALISTKWGRPVSTSDSTRFWEIARSLEQDLGMELFTPLEWDGDSISNGRVIVAVKASLLADGKTYVTWNREGDVYDGAVYFRSASHARSPRVVTHELMHALGFGHTRAWRSLMNTSTHHIDGPTVEDVAYAQVAVRLRRLQQAEAIQVGVAGTLRR